MPTFYHVAPATYNDGEDLLSWDAYVERYGEQPTTWKWEEAEEGFDTDIVCMFRADQRDDAEAFAAEYFDSAKLLTIELEDGEEGVHILTNAEGYACVMGRIPAWAIVAVEEVS